MVHVAAAECEWVTLAARGKCYYRGKRFNVSFWARFLPSLIFMPGRVWRVAEASGDGVIKTSAAYTTLFFPDDI